MSKGIFACLIFVCLIPVTLTAADDPFVGKWKSTTPSERIEALGGNRFKITWMDSVNTILADGTDQPADLGRTLSLKEESPNVWRVIWKENDKPTDQGTWKVEADGQTMVQDYTVYLPNGKSSRGRNKLQRIAGDKGLAGTWKFVERTHDEHIVLEIRPYEDGGLTFLLPFDQYSISMKFDGKQYPVHGLDVWPGTTSSGRRVDSRTLETVDTENGKLVRHQKWTISPDGATLTNEVPGHDKSIWDRMQ
jgi:hypothetical protein